MKNKALRRLSGALLAVVTALYVCGAMASAASVKLNKTSLTMIKSAVYTLSVSGTDKKPEWSSEDVKIAKVSSGGKVTAVSKGTTYIYAEVGTKKLKCRVSVINGTVSLSNSDVSIEEGGSCTEKVTVKGSKKLAYKSSDPSVATIAWGKWKGSSIPVKIKGNKAGTAVLTFYRTDDKSVYKKMTVTVTKGGGTDISELDYAEQVLYYTNLERTKLGLEPLVLDEDLCAAAQIRANEITELFSHTRPDGTDCFTVLEEAGIGSNILAGENIAAGASTAKKTVESWVNSPNHYASMINPDYSKLGVGYEKTSGGYSYYWVQLFTE